MPFDFSTSVAYICLQGNVPVVFFISLTEMSEPKEEMIPDKGLSVVKLSQDDDQGPNETNVDDLESDHENDSIDSFEDTDGEELSSEQFIENLTRPVSLASRSSQNSK